MRIVKAGYEILFYPQLEELILMEAIGRTPYKSHENLTGESHKEFFKRLISNHHEAMLEFADIIVKFIVDRGVSHELVRHRLCSFAQESTKFCNYTKQRFGGETTFVDLTAHLKGNILAESLWNQAMTTCERVYKEMIKLGISPQIARGVLPNSLKTEIVVKANIREWRKIFSLRTPITAHPQMREVMVPLLKDLQSLVPIVFDDLEGKE